MGTALAAPTSISPASPALALRQAGGATCGSNDYSSGDVSDAANTACNYVASGSTVGSNKYPHIYHDYEGFDLSAPGPWYEFPILASGQEYSGGSPGADRVIINDNCDLAGVLTHTGASGNNFKECSY